MPKVQIRLECNTKNLPLLVAIHTVLESADDPELEILDSVFQYNLACAIHHLSAKACHLLDPDLIDNPLLRTVTEKFIEIGRDFFPRTWEDWFDCEAHTFLYGLEHKKVYKLLRQAFEHGEFGGTMGELYSIIEGKATVRGIGPGHRAKLQALVEKRECERQSDELPF